jgi:outer membrane protein OmpA-like peptidoglycan-associated protein
MAAFVALATWACLAAASAAGQAGDVLARTAHRGPSSMVAVQGSGRCTQRRGARGASVMFRYRDAGRYRVTVSVPKDWNWTTNGPVDACTHARSYGIRFEPETGKSDAVDGPVVSLRLYWKSSVYAQQRLERQRRNGGLVRRRERESSTVQLGEGPLGRLGLVRKAGTETLGLSNGQAVVTTWKAYKPCPLRRGEDPPAELKAVSAWTEAAGLLDAPTPERPVVGFEIASMARQTVGCGSRSERQLDRWEQADWQQRLRDAVYEISQSIRVERERQPSAPDRRDDEPECELRSTGGGSAYVRPISPPEGSSSGWIGGKLLLANFDVCGSQLKPSHRRALEELVRHAGGGQVTDFRIESIVGRASQTGRERTNERLSRERAESVAQALSSVADVVAGSPTGIGSSRPIVDAHGREERLNRSVEVEFHMHVTPASEPTRPDRRGRGTDRWEMRLIGSGGLGEVVGAMGAIGEIRRQAVGSNPPGRTYRFYYLGYGLVLGDAIPGENDRPPWVPFRVNFNATERDFDATLCRLTSVGYGGGLLGSAGYSIAYFSFPLLSDAVLDVGGESWDTGFSGGTSFGICDVQGI